MYQCFPSYHYETHMNICHEAINSSYIIGVITPRWDRYYAAEFLVFIEKDILRSSGSCNGCIRVTQMEQKYTKNATSQTMLNIMKPILNAL